MMDTKVTVVIPTYNRARLLSISLASALAQDYPDFQVIVLDNASSDDTEQVVRSFADSRVTYSRTRAISVCFAIGIGPSRLTEVRI